MVGTLIVAILWLGFCILARTPAERGICSIGTCVLIGFVVIGGLL